MTLWTPAEIATALWLDAADGSTLYDAKTGGSLVTANAASIARWEDKSGNGRHATQAINAPTLRTNILNGLPVIRGNGINQAMEIDGGFLTGASYVSVFAVVIDRKGVTGVKRFFSRDFPSGGSYDASITAGNRDTGNYSIGGRRLAANSFVFIQHTSTASPVIFEGISDYANADLLQRINGVQVTQNLSYQTAGTLASSTVPIGIFGRFDGVTTGDYDLAELILLAADPGTDDRRRLEGYAAHRWGTASNLASDHPYKSAAPTLDGPSTSGRKRRLAAARRKYR